MVKVNDNPSDAKPDEPKAPKVKVMNDCLCGCGGKTARRFMPGHDARLKGELLRQATDPEAKAADRSKAEKRLNELNWGHFLTKAQATAERKAKAKAGRDEAAAERKQKAADEKAVRDAQKAEEKAAKAKAAQEKKDADAKAKADKAAADKAAAAAPAES